MDVTPKTLREVEFREKMRGYHPEDVDHFLEEVAAGVEVMQERMRQAVERAQRAEAAASEAGGNDETLRKTLVLAQRTADMAVQEAREQAARILAGAEQQAQGIIADAEEKGRRTVEDATAESRSELARLETSRAQAQEDVDTLNRWLDEHKTLLLESLREATEAIERGGAMWPAPSTHPSDPGGLPPLSPRPSPAQCAPDLEFVGENTAMWDVLEDERSEVDPDGLAVPPPPAAVSASPAPPAPTAAPAAPNASAAAAAHGEETSPGVSETNSADDRALDDFFEDSDEIGEDRRFGGRLRRRR
jgi:DivIVA domain-containing protein